uniref:Uncharacterized protein n=1 Tax=mine drainage metagenome TaxID=410659 RepID=E6QE33_9ZZZZ
MDKYPKTAAQPLLRDDLGQRHPAAVEATGLA